MTTEQAKRFKYWQYRTIIATMIGYALFYFVRKNFSFAIPGLAAEYGITNTSFGLIMTVVGLIYGLSRFMNGLIADRMNGRWHMSLHEDVGVEYLALDRGEPAGHTVRLHHGYVRP